MSPSRVSVGSLSPLRMLIASPDSPKSLVQVLKTLKIWHPVLPSPVRVLPIPTNRSAAGFSGENAEGASKSCYAEEESTQTAINPNPAERLQEKPQRNTTGPRDEHMVHIKRARGVRFPPSLLEGGRRCTV